MFIANKIFISTETRLILQKCQNRLIKLYRAMDYANIDEIREAGQNIDKLEILEGATLLGKILDIYV